MDDEVLFRRRVIWGWVFAAAFVCRILGFVAQSTGVIWTFIVAEVIALGVYSYYCAEWKGYNPLLLLAPIFVVLLFCLPLAGAIPTILVPPLLWLLPVRERRAAPEMEWDEETESLKPVVSTSPEQNPVQLNQGLDEEREGESGRIKRGLPSFLTSEKEE